MKSENVRQRLGQIWTIDANIYQVNRETAPTSNRVKARSHGLRSVWSSVTILVLGAKLIAGAISSCAFIGVAVGVGLIFSSLV